MFLNISGAIFAENEMIMSKKDLQETDYNPFKDIIYRFDCIEKKISEIHSLVQSLSDSITDKTAANKQAPSVAQETEMDRLDKKQAAKLLKVSVRTIDRYIKNGSIPYIQHGGKVTFSQNELLNSRFNRRHKNLHKDFLSILISDTTSSNNNR